MLAFLGCTRTDRPYAAATPDQTLDSAQQMIASGRADRLVELVYTEDDQTRSFLNHLGELLGSMQELAEAVEQTFPEELDQFRREAALQAEAGREGPILTRLVASGRMQQRRSTGFGISQIDRTDLGIDTGNTSPGPAPGPGFFRGARSESQRKLVNDVIKQLLADPYNWLVEGRNRIDTTYITDDTVSLTWDGRPILPPLGLILVLRDGRWQFVLPTSYPGLKKVMPRNDDEWFVWASIIKTLDNVVVDLTTDLRNGRIKNMTDLADTAVEKAAIPLMLVFFAYTNLLEERDREGAASRSSAVPRSAEHP